MNVTADHRLPLRLLDGGARLTRWALMVVTPLALVLGVLVVSGVGSLRLDGSTETVRPLQLEPGEYQIERGGQLTDVAQTTVFESRDGDVTFGTTGVMIDVGDDQTAIRAVAMVLLLAWLTLAWVGVRSLSGLAASLRAGERFMTANARRVRRIGSVVLAYPVLTFAGQLLLRQMVGSLELAGPSVVVDVGVTDWWAWVLFGLLLLALAELFAHGVTLQELEDATV